MHRTQIYLDDHEVALLTQVAERTGASRSELIRRAVRTLYGGDTPQSRVAALRASAGAWSNLTNTGAEFADSLREDANERLDRIGLR
jgi:metal-responsive CopG/Arc/MetJ family transcriptional regulator